MKGNCITRIRNPILKSLFDSYKIYLWFCDGSWLLLVKYNLLKDWHDAFKYSDENEQKVQRFLKRATAFAKQIPQHVNYKRMKLILKKNQKG